MSLIVVGTDTEVGKTVVSAVILARYGRRVKLAYWKPVATGAAQERDTDRIRRWVGHVVDVLPETYLHDPPLSPHLAARLSGESIDPERVLADLVRHGFDDRRRNLLIEGVGGVLVPLTDHGYLLVHLVRDLHLPCVLVARSTLGTINHTLLTLEALKTRDIKLAGVVLDGPRNPDNRQAIERFGEVRVIDEVEPLGRPGRKSIARAARRFDRRGRLKEYLCS